jgi:hypothetical protein
LWGWAIALHGRLQVQFRVLNSDISLEFLHILTLWGELWKLQMLTFTCWILLLFLLLTKFQKTSLNIFSNCQNRFQCGKMFSDWLYLMETDGKALYLSGWYLTRSCWVLKSASGCWLHGQNYLYLYFVNY